jgi:hypothetical protein
MQSYNLINYSDEQLSDELEERGYSVYEYSNDDTKKIEQLYSVWLTCSKETFEKELKKFFYETINKFIL